MLANILLSLSFMWTSANEPSTPTPVPYNGPCWFSSPELYSMEDIMGYLETLDEYGSFGAKVVPVYHHGVKWYVLYPKGNCLKKRSLKSP